MRKCGISTTHLIISAILIFISSLNLYSGSKAAIEKKQFGRLSDGKKAEICYLRNQNGMEAKITNYGATVVSLTAPDRKGKFSDVVLGFDKLKDYEKSTSYFGCIVGRFGNRIGKGKFSLDGKEYQLAINNGANHLHGGKAGFDKKLWTIEKTEMTQEGPSVTMSYLSPDGEENYPAAVKIKIVYTLKNDNSLAMAYEATADRTTIINPTNHSYFNLTGNPAKTVLNHELEIIAAKYTPVDEGLIPTGELAGVEGTPMDFRKAKKIGAEINNDFQQLKYGLGYDHNWVLDNYTGEVRKVLSLYEPETGRLLEISTDQPGMQFYSGNFLKGAETGKKGIKYQYRNALVLETQHFPDSPNRPEFPSTLLKPGEVYKQNTVLKFSAR
ncbi:MAG: aldose epimerase family protein [Syntrophothermus sp.]